MLPGPPPPAQAQRTGAPETEVWLRALRVLDEADAVLDDLCWWLLDLYEIPSTPSSAHETDA